MKYLKKFEGILQPYRLEEREELLKLEIGRKLSSEVIEGDLVIDHPFYLEVESRVKKVVGDVKIKLNKIPLWMVDVEVVGSFYCSWNNLTNLEGSPRVVGRDFRCSDNNLTNLEGAPESVGGHFSCSDNNLTNLEGSPSVVGRDFSCSDNNLTNLEGAPRAVDGSFRCSNNNLTNLEGAPRAVGGSFYCSWNKLTKLEGAPESVGGSFMCRNNPQKFTECDVRGVSKVRGRIYI